MLKLLDAGITRIGDEEVAVLVGGQAPGHVEFADVGAPPGKAEFAPGVHHGAVGPQALHAVVAAVGDVDVPVQPRGQPARIVEPALRRGGFAAPAGHERAVLVEFLDGVVVGIGDEDIAVLVEGHAGRRLEFAVVHPFPPEHHGDEVGRRNRHDFRRLLALALLGHDRHDVVVASPVGQVLMDVGGTRPFDARALLFRDPDLGRKILGRGHRSRQIGKLDLDPLRGQVVDVVVQGPGDRVPGERHAGVPRLGRHVGGSGRKVFGGSPAAGAPVVRRRQCGQEIFRGNRFVVPEAGVHKSLKVHEGSRRYARSASTGRTAHCSKATFWKSRQARLSCKHK